jgi:hypothetical protein
MGSALGAFYLFQAFLCHLGIYCRGLYVVMPEELLDIADVGAVFILGSR